MTIRSSQTGLVDKVYVSILISLSDAKARLPEGVRSVRLRGEDVVVTVDGELAVRLVPICSGPRPLTPAETASFRALLGGLSRIERPMTEFDAVELIGEGRR